MKVCVGRAYDRAAIKFRGLEADINFTLSDYEEDLKQVTACIRRVMYSISLWSIVLQWIEWDCSSDEKLDQGRVRAHTPAPEHVLREGELQIPWRHAAQVWSLGGEDGPAAWQEVSAL